jgi:exopolysaccharide production protein ExoQ
MPPELAALLCGAFIVYLFAKEFRSAEAESISWVPFAWMFIAGSRFVSSWLGLRAPAVSVAAYAEGSPVDRAVFLFLIVCGSIVLYRRNIDWHRLLTRNKLLVIYFAYCLCSIIWTDEPLVLAKRWIKDLGNPIMALILLTERRPYDAVGTTLKRLSFLFLPLSVLFIKYYPELGRGYSVAGGAMYTGVGDQKNALGLICLTAGVYYSWQSLLRVGVRRAMRDYGTLLLITQLGWLLYMSNSQTSLVCLVIAVTILFMSRLPIISVQPKRIVSVVVLSGLSFVALDQLVGIKEEVVSLLGRDTTLTNRTAIWDVVLSLHGNALVGTGFMSFWTGQRMVAVWNGIGAGLNQAHNGYVEQYLNLGYIGVMFIVAIATSAFLSVRAHLQTRHVETMLRLCLLVTALLYNYTEASFYGINNMWVLFLVASIEPAHSVVQARVRAKTATFHSRTVQEYALSASGHVLRRAHRPRPWRGGNAGGIGACRTLVR